MYLKKKKKKVWTLLTRLNYIAKKFEKGKAKKFTVGSKSLLSISFSCIGIDAFKNNHTHSYISLVLGIFGFYLFFPILEKSCKDICK